MPKVRKPKRYYPVANGKKGSVIYSNWDDADPNTTGISGAKCKGCDTLKEIRTFFSNYKVDLGTVTWAPDLDALDLTATDEEPAQPPAQNLATSIRASDLGARGRSVRLNLLPRKSDLRPSSFFHKVAAHTSKAETSAAAALPSSPPAPSAPSIPSAPPAPSVPAPIQPPPSSHDVEEPEAPGVQPLVTAEDIHDVQDGVRLVREGLAKIEAFASKMSSVASSEVAPPAPPTRGLPRTPPDQVTPPPLAVLSAFGDLASPRPSSSARDAMSLSAAPVQASPAAHHTLPLQEAAALQKAATPLTPAQTQRLAAAYVVLKDSLRDIGVGVEGTLLAFGDIEGQGSLFYREPLFFPG